MVNGFEPINHSAQFDKTSNPTPIIRASLLKQYIIVLWIQIYQENS